MSDLPGDFGVHVHKKVAHNKIFGNWLIETFGLEYLRRGGGVIDIGGGNGGFSWDLSVGYGVRCTLFEPRTVVIKSVWKRRMLKVCEKRSLINEVG